MLSRSIFAVLLLVVLATEQCRKEKPVGNDPEAVLDHFLCYAIVDNQMEFVGPQGLELQDQFFEELLPEKVSSRDYVCNPTSKAEKPKDEKQPPPEGIKPRRLNTHLVLYGINRTKITGQISVTNQLDKKPQLLTLIEQRFLALPSGKQIIKDMNKLPKNLPAVPTNIDHFKCYTVDQKKAPTYTRTYDVTDELYSDEIKAPRAAFVCNPVEKHVKGEPPKTRSQTFAHLACYVIASASRRDTVRIVNQFEPKGSIPLDVDGPDFLCIPSTKEIKEAPRKGK
jgi:hypothetical protein